jgi:hypothetical protein
MKLRLRCVLEECRQIEDHDALALKVGLIRFNVRVDVAKTCCRIQLMPPELLLRRCGDERP